LGGYTIPLGVHPTDHVAYAPAVLGTGPAIGAVPAAYGLETVIYSPGE